MVLILNPTQHGFRAGRSCFSAMLDVYDDILGGFSDDASCVDMDFAKAFNKVDHGIFLHKLKDFGITGKLGFWFSTLSLIVLNL